MQKRQTKSQITTVVAIDRGSKMPVEDERTLELDYKLDQDHVRNVRKFVKCVFEIFETTVAK